MTREELMINDIVFDYTNSPVKVCAVGQDIVVKNVFGVGVLDPNELNPIPLTEEILVNNGFVGVPLTDSYELNTDYYEIEVWNYSDGLWVVNVHWIEFPSTPESKATVSYVHELQHLFHLCGIEKELVID